MKKTLLAAGLGVVFALSASPAIASCIEPPPLREAIEEAPGVFVGTVVAFDEVTVTRGPEEAIGDTEWVTTREMDPRRATVRVEEVRKGGPLPDEVKVYGASPDYDPSVWSTTDRAFTMGTRYLFVPHAGGPPFRDSACSNTQEYGDGLVKAFAAGRDGLGQTAVSQTSPGWAILTVALGVTLLAAVALRRPRRRRGVEST